MNLFCDNSVEVPAAQQHKLNLQALTCSVAKPEPS